MEEDEFEPDLGSDAIDRDDPAISDDESLSSPDLQDPIWSPPPSHKAFTCHLNIPEQTMESELPQSALTMEVNDNHPAPGPCPTTAIEQPITSTSVQHSSEASSVPHDNSGHVSRAGRIRKIRAVNLNSCICGVVILESDIKSGDTVMKCRVPGCETTWVRKQQICFMISLLTCPLVPSGLHELQI